MVWVIEQPIESSDALDIDERALDRSWENKTLEQLRGYKATPEQVRRLKTLPERRASMYAKLPSREERKRSAAQLRAQAKARVG